MAARTRGLVWLLPAVVTFAVCAYGAGRPLLWADELATWNAADRSPRQILHLLHNVDAVIGVYYLLIHFWTEAFGHSLAMIRMPSVLAMAGAAAFVTLIGRKLFGTTAGVVAGLLFALIPSVSRYGQEARGYAFVVLFAAAATFLLLRALERPGVLRWVLYALALIGAGAFHMISLVFLVPHALVAAWRWWDGRSRGVLIGFPLAALGGVLPLVPLVLLGQRQVGRQLNWLGKPSLEYVAAGFWHGLFASSWIGLCVLAMAVLPLAWSRGRRPAAEIGMIAVLPIPLLWIISQGHTSYFLDRYLLFTLPAWAVLAGAGLTALRPRALTAIGLISVLLLGAHDQRALRLRYSHAGWDGAAAAKVIAQGYQPGDAVAPLRYGNGIFNGVVSALDFYLPEQDKLKDVFVERSAIAKGDLYPTLCTDLAACLGDTKRIWVVAIGWGDSFQGFSPEETALLKKTFPKTTVTQVPNTVVTLMER
ncbi:glycosyltransferase family 39 protein [Kitasatospora sp. NA04385]|uniref:glycosyltransferase family 39 protein n=1 Tax=Kitasatospora sp. NA04385 TaxID=2742135 RepID=UPI0015902D8B|nr:glycosyltransferase family 39 protein [Kitasatospora sp. NA04385]QKW19925.1 glycosyltransferase family 39 protein [Kitasatospora sp. NA04385]